MKARAICRRCHRLQPVGRPGFCAGCEQRRKDEERRKPSPEPETAPAELTHDVPPEVVQAIVQAEEKVDVMVHGGHVQVGDHNKQTIDYDLGGAGAIGAVGAGDAGAADLTTGGAGASFTAEATGAAGRATGAEGAGRTCGG